MPLCYSKKLTSNCIQLSFFVMGATEKADGVEKSVNEDCSTHFPSQVPGLVAGQRRRLAGLDDQNIAIHLLPSSYKKQWLKLIHTVCICLIVENKKNHAFYLLYLMNMMRSSVNLNENRSCRDNLRTLNKVEKYFNRLGSIFLTKN